MYFTSYLSLVLFLIYRLKNWVNLFESPCTYLSSRWKEPVQPHSINPQPLFPWLRIIFHWVSTNSKMVLELILYKLLDKLKLNKQLAQMFCKIPFKFQILKIWNSKCGNKHPSVKTENCLTWTSEISCQNQCNKKILILASYLLHSIQESLIYSRNTNTTQNEIR
jgi:hypothetical protein